jgi:hypothetical protein
MKRKTLFAAALAALTGVALAVPPVPAPPPSSGPDVVTSGIGASASASAPFGEPNGVTPTKNGTVGGISAFSVSTVSCNIGNQRAIWIDGIAPANRHPVIGTQMYRVSQVNGANQFNMLGLNWLKHGFCALDAANCSSLTNPTGGGGTIDNDCDWLQPFSTDTYSAGLNGQQSNLGPRSEVNPWTGAYPYPYILQSGATGDAVFKRTQVANSDLVAGSGYIIECVYITTDEPPANRYNNYAYRLATVTGNGASATLDTTGPTQSMQTAIDAWSALESGVTKVAIDPSGIADGRLTLGYKVTQTGPSTWHYEYALHNMNNDAGVRLFSLPVFPGVTITNTGFRDVAYHSGEPYDGNDWILASGGGALTWFCQTFAEFPNANALRWSTAYSFRFDANQPPSTGTLTLGMFKTGASVAVNNVAVPAVPPPPAPGPFNLSSPANASTVANLTPTLSWSNSSNATTYTVTVATDPELANQVVSQDGLGGTLYGVPSNLLVSNTRYYWGVTAFGDGGRTVSSPASFSFLTPPPACPGDINGDGSTNTLDLTIFLGNFGTNVPPGTNGDFDGNGQVNTADLTFFLGNFGCNP